MPATPQSAPAPKPTLASASWAGGERFLTLGSSGHAVVMDADRAANSAPGPMEMVLRSLCACSATDMVIVLSKTRQPFTAVEVTAEGERAPEPPTVYRRIHMVYRVAGRNLDPAAVERAVNLSLEKYCSVLATLRGAPRQSTSHTAEITHEIKIEAAA